VRTHFDGVRKRVFGRPERDVTRDPEDIAERPLRQQVIIHRAPRRLRSQTTW
jgi:hypothetical protein